MFKNLAYEWAAILRLEISCGEKEWNAILQNWLIQVEREDGDEER